jgi:hypothetical protein
MQHKYCIYATLLDSFQNYLNSSKNWEKFWGSSEEPAKSIDEYEKECFNELIDRINRVPFESEAADRGTAFNEIIDCMIAHKNSEKMLIEVDKENNLIKALFQDNWFMFPLSVCLEFHNYFKNAVSQVYCEGILPTKYGNVLLYGYIDELLFDKIHDIKTTGNYEAWKYRNNWQHRVYPYCLEQQGNIIAGFEYNILEIKGKQFNTYTEFYKYDFAKTKEELTSICEHFIEFVENNKELITDQKIRNYDIS